MIWCLYIITLQEYAVIKGVIRGNVGLIQVANICTSTDKTTQPITKLNPLEITSINESMTSDVDSSGDSTRESDPLCSQGDGEQPKAAARAHGLVWKTIVLKAMLVWVLL